VKWLALVIHTHGLQGADQLAGEHVHALAEAGGYDLADPHHAIATLLNL
jgi:hypothetical protein